MNMNLLHDITFYVMYGAAALAAFVVVERCIFFSYSLRKARQLVPAVNGKVRSIADLPAGLTARDSLPLQLLSQIYDGRRQLHSHQELEDLPGGPGPQGFRPGSGAGAFFCPLTYWSR